MIRCKHTTISILLTSFIVSKHVMHLHKIFLSNYNDMMIETIFYFQKHFKLYINLKKIKNKIKSPKEEVKENKIS
jgi:hypothetical protein